jgi:hypothetical protein
LPFPGGGTARFHVLRALVAALGDGEKQVFEADVSGGAAMGPCAGAQQGRPSLFAHAIAVRATGARVLVLGNWCSETSVVAALGPLGSGASVTMVNATAGTDTAPPAVSRGRRRHRARRPRRRRRCARLIFSRNALR